MSDFRNLKVWKKSHELTLQVYRVIEKYPKHEMYGLGDQIRRAASSIPMNIAEGCGTLHKKEFIRYLSIARASTSELEYQLILSKDLNYIEKKTYDLIYPQIKEIQSMLNGMIKSVKKQLTTK